MRSRIWVAVLYVSDRVRQKIIRDHSIEVEALRDAVVCVSGLACTWNDSPARGRRALLEVWIGRDRVLVVLYPTGVDPDEYHLGSAYPVSSN